MDAPAGSGSELWGRIVPLLGSTTAGKAKRFSSHAVQRYLLVGTLAFSDAVLVSLALILAWYLRIESGILDYSSGGRFDDYLRMVAVAVPLLLALFWVNGLYHYDWLLGGMKEYEAVARGCTYGVVLLAFVTFMWRDFLPSRGWLLISWGTSILFVGTSRFAWRRLFLWIRRRYGWFTALGIIVGATEHGRSLARQLTRTGVEVVGFIDEFLPAQMEVIDGKRVLGTPDQVHEVALQYGVSQVILLPNAVAWETFEYLLRQASLPNGFELHMSPGYYEILTTGVHVVDKGFTPLLRVESARIVGSDCVLKTALDLALGTLLLVVSSPIILCLSVALWLCDGRPIFERHEVFGLGGRTFRTRKFRTGLQGSALRCLAGANVIGESRADLSSRMGRFLFRTGLDKLPQLVDVLQGRMSLVGPRTVSVARPEMPDIDLPNLFTLKPGWTGLWAVGGTDTTAEEMRLNLYYARNWTIWLDLQILFQTAKKALHRRSRSTT